MGEPRVSIVVPLFNRSFYTRLFLLAARDLLRGSGAELVLVDNGSSDDTPELLDELAGGATVVRLASNANFAGGCNAGAARSRGEPATCAAARAPR